ncbi:hypothetical protein CYLTODRAFT_455210 [Cylindrobasidium torrendii FP15055 ss-10]|uniref:F-box domain-containing protein n=1 Tax=Cylindrobasidium torrendii FP15055 ss-10 TaxID=1314674 RepID=A0A0D7B7X2_9AGAR|nr:hypothetical protein CYLTODRAFT_455210 [Cylindrobasidium torrendii FP15055 ss-10]
MATTIASLPVEILAEIFASTQFNRLVLSDRARAEENTRAAIAVSQVCHQWRAVALGLPKLWANIAWGTHKAHRLGLVSAQIERCRGLPMLFNIVCPKDKSTQGLVHDSIAGHLRNAKHIFVKNCTTRILTTILTHDAPHLRSLHIEASSMIRLPAESRLPAKKFESLTKLMLVNVDIAFLNLICKAEIMGLGELQFPVHVFLHPFAPTLTSLVLFINVTATDPSPNSPLVLPVLKFLSFIVPLEMSVLLAINMPRLEQLRIRAYSKNSFTAFLASLPTSWALKPPTKLRILDIIIACPQEEHTVMQHSSSLELMLSVFSNISYMNWSGHTWDALMEFWGKRLGERGEDGKFNMPNLRGIELDKKESHATLVDVLAGQRPELSIVYKP